MKNNKIKIIILLFICIYICTGCGKNPNKLLLTCKSSIDSVIEDVKKEKIQVNIYNNNKTKRKITIVIDNPELESEKLNEILELTKQNYCNSEIKTEYYCDVETIEPNKLVIKEEGQTKDVMGIVKETSIVDYRNMLELKGFKCTEK